MGDQRCFVFLDTKPLAQRGIEYLNLQFSCGLIATRPLGTPSIDRLVQLESLNGQRKLLTNTR